MPLNPNPTVVITTRRVTLLNNPYINPLNNLLWTTGQDNRGFQYQIALDALPAGVTIDIIKQGQVWFIENSSTAYRLSMYVGQISVSTIQGVTVSGTPTAGTVLTATSASGATWQSSGGGLPSWFMSGAGDPLNNVTPGSGVKLYYDTNGTGLYFSTGPTNIDWAGLGANFNSNSDYGFQFTPGTVSGSYGINIQVGSPTDPLALVGGSSVQIRDNTGDGLRVENGYVSIVATDFTINTSSIGGVTATSGQTITYDGSNWTPQTINKTFELPYTFSVSGPLAVASNGTNYLPPFFWPVPSGQTVQLISVVGMTRSTSTTTTIDIYKNGSTVTGLTGLSITSSPSTTTLSSPLSVSNNDYFQPKITAIGGTPDGLSLTFFFKVTA